MSNEIKNEAMNGNVKVTEKISYKGELRIIGRVVDVNNIKKVLGYVIMVEKTQQFKMYTEEQTKILLSKFKFVNAELDGGNIINTECAMEKILKFDDKMHVIGNFGITVIAEIFSGDNAFGYRVLGSNGKIADIKKEDLLTLVDKGNNLINAKVVTRNSKQYISGIKDSFTRIDKNSIKYEKPKQKSKEELWRHQKRVDKLVYKWAPKVLRNAMFSRQTLYFPWGLLAEHTGKQYDESNIHFRKIINIMTSEILPSYIKTSEDEALLKKLMNMFNDKIDDEIQYNTKNEYNKAMAVGLCQFLASDEKFCREVLKVVKPLGEKTVYDKLHGLELTTKDFDSLYLRMKKSNKDKYNKIGREPFNTCNFNTTSECAQLGFAINAKDEGVRYTTLCGSKYTLKYIGNYIDAYDHYKSMARCLGDVLCLAQIERTLSVNYLDDKEKIARVETILAIMSMYRPDIVKEYLKINKTRFENYGFLPGLDLDSTIDYKLPDELKMYYESGFNVFLSDENMHGPYEDKYYNIRHYGRYRLKNSKYINYRGLSAGIKCLHNMLYTELAPIVAMITSENVDNEMLNNIIGNLRML